MAESGGPAGEHRASAGMESIPERRERGELNPRLREPAPLSYLPVVMLTFPARPGAVSLIAFMSMGGGSYPGGASLHA